MFKSCLLLLCLLLLTGVIFISAATVNLDADSLSLWPQPQIIKNIQDGSKIPLDFSRICLDKSAFVESEWNKLAECEKNFISNAFTRLSTRYQFQQLNTTTTTNCVKFSLKQPISSSSCKISLLNSSEKYEIWLNGNYSTIQTDNIYGVLRAIQTLSQIMDQANSIVKNQSPPVATVLISPLYIQDFPFYNYRGLMLDIARHFIAIDSLKRHVDSMEVVKLNAFHLHITDDESFPLNMTSFSGSSSSKFNGGPLTFEILKDLNEYCADRGIQFIPEIDSPSHSTSWSQYYPSIMYPSCANHLDMGKQETYQVVSSVYQFLFKLLGSWTQTTPRVKFSNQLLHTGFDEIDGTCYADLATLQKYQSSVLNNVLQNGSTIANGDSTDKILPIVWADDLISDMKFGNTSALPRDTILQIWRSQASLTEALKYYYKTIVSISEPWYIDAPCSRTFEKVYQYAPPVHPSIIGGETCMWTSASDTDSDLEEYVWPRAAAVAERLWTNPCNPITFWNSTFSYNNQKMSRKKIVVQRIVKTGLNAQTWDCSPITNPTFSSNCTSSNNNIAIPAQPSLGDPVVQRSTSFPPVVGQSTKVTTSTKANHAAIQSTSSLWTVVLLLLVLLIVTVC